MSGKFAPFSYHTLQFAKHYRTEQVRAAEQARLVAALKTSRRGFGSLVHRTWTALVSRGRHKSPGTVPEHPRTAL